MIRFCRPVMAALLGLPLTAALAQVTRPELPFHPPEAEVERALDAILHRADGDTDLLSNLLDGGGGRGFRRTVDYAPC